MSEQAPSRTRWWVTNVGAPFVIVVAALVISGGIQNVAWNLFYDPIRGSPDTVQQFIRGSRASIWFSWPAAILLTAAFVAWIQRTGGDA